MTKALIQKPSHLIAVSTYTEIFLSREHATGTTVPVTQPDEAGARRSKEMFVRIATGMPEAIKMSTWNSCEVFEVPRRRTKL